jgi:hypothetical protein
MTGYDAATAFVFVGQFAHQVDIHLVGGMADIEVHVDIDVELARQLENAVDLSRPILVGAPGRDRQLLFAARSRTAALT